MHASLLLEFPEIVGITDDFECFDCDDIHDLCTVWFEIVAWLKGSDFLFSDSTVFYSVVPNSIFLDFASYDSANYVLAIPDSVFSDPTPDSIDFVTLASTSVFLDSAFSDFVSSIDSVAFLDSMGYDDIVVQEIFTYYRC